MNRIIQAADLIEHLRADLAAAKELAQDRGDQLDAIKRQAEDATEYVLAQINQQLKAELAAAKEQIAAYREELEDVRDDLDDNPDAYALIGIRARIGATLGDFKS